MKATHEFLSNTPADRFLIPNRFLISILPKLESKLAKNTWQDIILAYKTTFVQYWHLSLIQVDLNALDNALLSYSQDKFENFSCLNLQSLKKVKG